VALGGFVIHLLGDLDFAGRRRDTVGIEDHDDAAIAQNGVAGEHLNVAQDARHWLDDDFFGVEDTVDYDAEGVAADLGDHDELVGGLLSGDRRRRRFAGRRLSRPISRGDTLRLGRFAAQVHQRPQADQRQQPIAQAQDRRAIDALDRIFRVRRGADQLQNADLRYGEALAAAFDDQGRYDGQGQRDLDRQRGALALDRIQFDRAADLLDVGAHHVHADAATGY